MKTLIAIVGPTAVGKSKLALYLSGFLPAEIINADSRQVYRFMDIGTAKPTPEERKLVNHHLIDIVNPDQEFNLSIYLKLAEEVIKEVQERGKIPILVGGSGQYVWALIEGWQIPPVEPDKDLRSELEILAKREGGERLYQMLKELDPQAASEINPRNIRRVIRAIEVCRKIGSFSAWRRKIPPQFPIHIIGLTLPRERLYKQIDLRVGQMIKRGWIEEVRGLLDRGYDPSLPSLSSIGYRELIDYLRGREGLEMTIQRIKWRIHDFARHQYSWFRPSDPRIKWFLGEEKLFPLIKSFLLASLA